MTLKICSHNGKEPGGSASSALRRVAKALDAGADLVELDVRATKDGKFINLHDDHVMIEGKHRKIRNLYDSDISALPDYSPLPPLLDLIRGRAVAHIDLKDPTHECGLVDLCIAHLGASGFIVTTLEDESVRRIRAHNDKIHVALSIGRSVRGMNIVRALRLRHSELFPARRVRRCDPTMLAVHHCLARVRVLRWAWRNNLPVLVWTVDDRRLIRKIAKDGRYWGLVTNEPRRALDVIHEVTPAQQP